MAKNHGSKRFLLISILVLVVINVLLFGVFIFASKSQRPSKVPTAEEVNRLVKECENESGAINCYSQEFYKINKKNDLDYSLALLDKLEAADPQTRGCHLISHYIARAEIQKDPSKWKDFIKKIDVLACNYGFMHGALETLSGYDPKFIITPKNIPTLCREISAIKNGANVDQGCAHIMGHVVMAQNCSRTMPEIVNKTTKVCDQVKDPYQHECYAGAFMESFTRDNLQVHCDIEHIAWDDEQIKNEEELCESYKGGAALSCWQEISHMYNARTEYDPQGVYDQCSHAPEKEQVAICYRHAVNTLALKPNADREYLASICEPVRSDSIQYGNCISNVAYSVIYSSYKLSDRAVAFCKSLDPEPQKYCFMKVTDAMINTLPDSQKQNYCKMLPAQNRQACEQ